MGGIAVYRKVPFTPETRVVLSQVEIMCGNQDRAAQWQAY